MPRPFTRLYGFLEGNFRSFVGWDDRYDPPVDLFASDQPYLRSITPRALAAASIEEIERALSETSAQRDRLANWISENPQRVLPNSHRKVERLDREIDELERAIRMTWGRAHPPSVNGVRDGRLLCKVRDCYEELPDRAAFHALSGLCSKHWKIGVGELPAHEPEEEFTVPGLQQAVDLVLDRTHGGNA
jgi:hypothetical protein